MLPPESPPLACAALDGNSLLAARLPPELEHIIFTLVACRQPEMHSTLNLVCRRIKEWCVLYWTHQGINDLRLG
jgi:hypothetical protein